MKLEAIILGNFISEDPEHLKEAWEKLTSAPGESKADDFVMVWAPLKDRLLVDDLIELVENGAHSIRKNYSPKKEMPEIHLTIRFQ